MWNPGIYFARLTFLPRMDLRDEPVSSQGLFKDFGPYHFFTNSQDLDEIPIKVSWLETPSAETPARLKPTSYWFSDRTRVEAGYR